MIQAIALPSLPEIEEGDDLAALLISSAKEAGLTISNDSLLAISHKVISKAEGRVVSLDRVSVNERASELANTVGKDARLVELILSESREVLRAENGVLICQTKQGFICANAGVDQSNAGGPERAVLLPQDPDRSAAELRARVVELTGMRPAIAISDSFGRPWRLGQSEVLIGCAGLVPLDDLRGERDSDGRMLEASEIAIGDQVAAAADLARSKTDRRPAVLLSGLDRYITAENGPGAARLLRPVKDDLFR